MYTQRTFRVGVLGLAAMAMLPLAARTAKAEFIITFSQDAANVDASGTGSLDFTDLSFSTGSTGGPAPFVDASTGTVLLTALPGGTDIFTGSISGPTSFGSGGNNLATSGTTTGAYGTGAGIDASAGELFVPGGYFSGDPITVSSVWANTTISDLGLTPGTYTWTWGSGVDADSLEVIIPATAASVPEPSTLGIFCLGGLVLAGAIRGKNRATA